MVKYNGHKIKKTGQYIVVDGIKKEVFCSKLLYENKNGQIYAKNGVKGLYAFIKELIKEDKTGMWLNSIINGVING